MISICMITIKPDTEVQDRIDEALSNARGDYEFILVSNPSGGVAKNRNDCLRQCKGDFVIFIDDDLYGFPESWDETMIRRLRDPSVLMMGARLLNIDGSIQNTVSKSSNVVDDYVPVEYVPGACMAYRKNDLIFNEEYHGWGMEDIEFTMKLKQANPAGRVYLTNLVRLKHKNEMKREPEFGKRNKELFRRKWGFVIE